MPSWLHEASINEDSFIFAVKGRIVDHDLLLFVLLALLDHLSPLTFRDDVDKVFTLFVIQLNTRLLGELSQATLLLVHEWDGT